MSFRLQSVLALALALCLVPASVVYGQQMPASPASPGQAPSKAPQVTFSNGQLKVTAENSTLKEVLTLVASRTGVVVEGSTDSGNERVVVNFGPAPVEEVLRKLLLGSRFDYVILGSATKPGGVDRIVLSPRRPGSASPPSAQAAPPPGPEEEPLVEEPVGMEIPGNMPSGPPLPGQPVPANMLGPGIDPMTGQPSVQMGTPPTEDTRQDSSQPKTPEQLLRELQMMQQREQNQAGEANR